MDKKEKLLHQQLEILAEQSKEASEESLPALSEAMAEVYQVLQECGKARIRFLALLLAVGSDFLVSLLVLIVQFFRG